MAFFTGTSVYKNLFNLRHLLTIMEQVSLFFVANKDIKDAMKINPFRIKTFVFFASWCETLKNKIDRYTPSCIQWRFKRETGYFVVVDDLVDSLM
ncbi:MAG: hypothetical protein LBQ50_04290 [Planctomycetaceae bacterium]|nr:hypothetical protein [Planctomycetaceae bacterium]